MDALERRQHELNRTSVDRWALFEEHRRQVTAAILSQVRDGGGDLCIVGAGNCNDIDLSALWQAGCRLHLVDVDGAALAAGLARQRPEVAAATRSHRGVDVTGVLARFIADGATEPGEERIDRLVREAAHPSPLPVPGGMDVAVSVCVLSQLIATVEEAVGKGHARIEEIADALRAGHLRTLLSLVRPGGRVVVVTEVASEENLPAIVDAPDERIGGLLLRAIATRDLFTGLGPDALVSWIARHRPYGARLATPGVIGPWRWRLNRRRTYLVVGVLLHRP